MFTLHATGGGYELASVNSGKCLDDTDWSTGDGTPLQRWDCSGNANQRWRLERVE